ncbi:NUDIX hydrolase [Nocardia sp. NPDC051570]|uniref:NUDIX hydrolase n=1 Tax=Nocardia sp. NPDC051570 TaxID=3364324 RepID=UPI0037B28D87
MGPHQNTFARVIVTNPVGHVLLVRDHFGYWNLPGGKVEPGEKPAAAAARELQEETGLTIVEIEEIHHGDYEFDGVFWTGHFYRAPCVSGQPELQEPDKATELAYRDPAEVAFHPAVSAAMTALLSSSPVLRPTVNRTSVDLDRNT